MEDHIRTLQADPAAAECSSVDEGVGAYTKPTLVRLGRWNVFTRAPSENPNEGFFEFDFSG